MVFWEGVTGRTCEDEGQGCKLCAGTHRASGPSAVRHGIEPGMIKGRQQYNRSAANRRFMVCKRPRHGVAGVSWLWKILAYKQARGYMGMKRFGMCG